MRYCLVVLVVVVLLSGPVFSQTCCSSGVPIASNLGFQPQGGNVLQVSLAVEHNRLSTLYNEREILDDDRRLRVTNSVLGRVAYGIGNRFNVEILVPYVRQLRVVTLNSGSIERDGGQGLGDITALGQVGIVENQFSNFSIGGGMKLPTGANDLKNRNGLTLVNDLQLGSNTTDFLARMSAVRIVTMRPSMSFFLNATAVFRGVNKVYLGSQTYQFGNEIQANVGYSDQLFFAQTLIYPSLSFRFRHALQDRVNNNQLENTGGSWVFARMGVGMDVYMGNRLTITGEYPLFTRVDGTQLSPDFVVNVAYYKAINFSPDDF